MSTPDPINVYSVTVTTSPVATASALVQGVPGPQGPQGQQGIPGPTGFPDPYVVSVNGRTGAVGLPLATTGTSGIASFFQNHFTVQPSGQVRLNNTAYVSSFNAQTGVINFGIPVASYTVTGSAMFDRDDFSVTQYGMVRVTGNYVRSLSGLTGNLTITGTENKVSVTKAGTNIVVGLPDNVTIKNLTVTGSFTILGGITTQISEVVLIQDNFLTLNADVTGGVPVDNAGIIISRGASANVELRWNETTDAWQFTNNGSIYYNIPVNVVNTINGTTGDISNVATLTAANQFTDLQTLLGGLTSNHLYVSKGVTFNSASVHTGLATFNNGITSDHLYVSKGATFNGPIKIAGITGGLSVTGGATITGGVALFGTVTVNGTPLGSLPNIARLDTEQVFTEVQRFNSGINVTGNAVFNNGLSANGLLASNGATFDGNAYFSKGLSANNLYVAGGITFGGDIKLTDIKNTNSFFTIGYGLTMESGNVKIGDRALFYDGSIKNVAIGKEALRDTNGDPVLVFASVNGSNPFSPQGGGNIAIGEGALRSGLTSLNNVAIGDNAGTNIQWGYENVLIGAYSMAQNSSGSYRSCYGNVGIGPETMFRTIGNENVAVGGFAGKYRGTASAINTSATGGIYIGYKSKASANAQTNEIVIGRDAVGMGSNSAVIGATTQRFAQVFGLLSASTGLSTAGATFSGTLMAQGNVILNNGPERTTTIRGQATFENSVIMDDGASIAGGISVTGGMSVTGDAIILGASGDNKFIALYGDVILGNDNCFLQRNGDFSGLGSVFCSQLNANILNVPTGSLNVTLGDITANGGKLQGRYLVVDQGATFNGAANFTKGITTNSLTVTGSATFQNGINVTGNSTVGGMATFLDKIILGLTAPVDMTSGALGTTGEIKYGYNNSVAGWYLYVCIGTNQWTRTRINGPWA